MLRIPPHLPVGPASEAGARAAVCLTGAVALGAYVTGLSLTVCPRVATILVLSKSSFKVDFKSRSAWRRLCYRVNTGHACTSADHLSLLLSCLNQHGAGGAISQSVRCRLHHRANTGCTGTSAAYFRWLLSCLWNVLFPRHHLESLLLTGLAPEIPDKPQEMLSLVASCTLVLLVFTPAKVHVTLKVCARRHPGPRLSRGLARRVNQPPRRTFYLPLVVCPGRFPDITSVSPSLDAQQRSLLQEPSTAVGQNICASVIRLSFSPASLSLSLSLSLSGVRQQEPRALALAGHIGHLRLCSTQRRSCPFPLTPVQ